MANFALTSKAKIMILFANQYDMKDDSGNKVTGCSVHYLFWGENGEALASEAEFDPTKPVGVQRAKCSLDPMFRMERFFQHILVVEPSNQQYIPLLWLCPYHPPQFFHYEDYSRLSRFLHDI